MKFNIVDRSTNPTPAPAPRRKRTHEALAIDGGPAVRSKPLPGPYPGALLIGKEEEKLVLEVLRSKSLFRFYGPDVLGKCLEFEKRFAARVSTKHALAVNSGTSALKCALFAAGVGPGDEVLVPAYSYVATSDVVLSLGATPVYVEIDETMTMDPEDLRRKISAHRGVKAITVVHLFGVAADMDPILEIAREHGVPVVEDCAQSLGASYKGRTTGSIGDIGITSFQLNKMITAGEGGAIMTSNDHMFDRAMRLHDHGNHRANESMGKPLIGEGFRLGELSAAVLLAQLGRLDGILAKLRDAKKFLVEELKDVKGMQLARVADTEGDAGAGLIFFVESAELAGKVVAALNAEGIRALRQYGGKLLYAQPAVKSVQTEAAVQLCPKSADLVSRSVFLGLTTTFSKKDLRDIVTAVKKVLRNLA
jgi:8-amino-3,8-dideoxy-alpha-D-manno-octulosonate transaminase